jgi:tetratricopeptide (TPR) repeat protein
MPDSAQVRSAVEAAERAATAGDFIAAARHLRQALALQEAELGPAPPDLASTLNNLGVVSERIGDFAEAERCYRRACEIVSAAFPAEHPFVETSRQNLAAFCAARSVPVGAAPSFVSEPARPATPSAAEPTAAMPPRPAIEALRPRGAPPPALPSTVAPRPPRRALVPLVVAGLMVVGFLLWFNRGQGADAPASGSSSSSTAAPSSPVPAARDASSAIAPAPPAPAAARSVATPKPPPDRASSREGSPTVVDAQLCRTLTRGAQWTCARAADPLGPGHVYFYTRVTTPRDTVIVHRWYRDDRVQLSRELPIEANLGSGYRTYSHLMLDARSAGQWRVELRTADGRVLREERFVVR